jgi:hypothetical protein
MVGQVVIDADTGHAVSTLYGRGVVVSSILTCPQE